MTYAWVLNCQEVGSESQGGGEATAELSREISTAGAPLSHKTVLENQSGTVELGTFFVTYWDSFATELTNDLRARCD